MFMSSPHVHEQCTSADVWQAAI